MAPLMAPGTVCTGSNKKPAGVRTIEKQRRNDQQPGEMIIGWCAVCRSWIAIKTNGFLRPHKKR